MRKINVVFLGSPSFSATLLNSIMNYCNIITVITQPPRPANRGKKTTPTPVHELALSYNLPTLHPTQWDQQCIRQLIDLHPDLIITAAYKHILPQEILTCPKIQSVNVHYSLLPKWRGAAPIERAIIAGDSEVGISLMNMEKTLDTGNIISQQRLALDYTDLHLDYVYAKLTILASRLLIEYLTQVQNNQTRINGIPQNNMLATYAPKINKEETQINWLDDSALIYRKIIAYKGKAHFYYDHSLRILAHKSSVNCTSNGPPGTEVTPRSLNFFCGRGTLQLEKVQKEGGEIISSLELIRGYCKKT